MIDSTAVRNFLLHTATGWIFLINLLVFLVTCWLGGTFFGAPSADVLISLGAKDTVRLVQGEWWRFFTPVFIHVGMMHFAFNSLGLCVIGPRIEEIFGKRLFLLVYIGAGIAGNLCSAVFTLGISAGASGALFGLLGAGWYLDRRFRRRLQELSRGMLRGRSNFTILVVINVLFGFIMPGIDNAAHIGGLLFGVAATMAILRLRPNRIVLTDRRRGLRILLATAAVLLVLAIAGVDRNFALQRLLVAADYAEPPLAYFYYSNALQLAPAAAPLYFKRGVLLLRGGAVREALADLRIASRDPAVAQTIAAFLDAYAAEGFRTEADIIRRNLQRQNYEL